MTRREKWSFTLAGVLYLGMVAEGYNLTNHWFDKALENLRSAPNVVRAAGQGLGVNTKGRLISSVADCPECTKDERELIRVSLANKSAKAGTQCEITFDPAKLAGHRVSSACRVDLSMPWAAGQGK